MLLVGCGAKKKVAESQKPVVVTEPEVPAWHTCLIQSARATIVTDEDRISANVTMQTVRDSMLVISVMPLLGIEMLRVEATPMEIIAIDKIHGQWAQALAESWASWWFIKACGSSNGSVALEISFVDQANHEIGTYEGSFSLSDVQVLTETAGS